MLSVQIKELFPTPLYCANINREFTKKELLCVETHKKNYLRNEFNYRSKDSYVLNNKIFNKIKKEINISILDYFEKIISPENKIIPYITQSWFNYTEEKESHHRHSHSNSLISGVLYISADETNDNISFFTHKLSQHDWIRIHNKNLNQFNATEYFMSVKTGDLILFPSSLMHCVNQKRGDNTRISLAFNVFIKGKIGSDERLTGLILK